MAGTNGSKKYALVSSLLWILNPLAIVASSWYGLFDSIPVFFSLLSIYYLRNLYVSAIILSLGIITKIFPAVIMLPVMYAIYRIYKRIDKIIMYIAIVGLAIVLIEIPFIYRCPLRAIEQQLLFHITRGDRGLSLLPNIQYIDLLSTIIAMVIGLLISLYNGSLEQSIFASFTILNVLNSFIYPHYILWFLPWLYISLSIRNKRGTIVIESIVTIVYSIIALSYWKFYRNAYVVEMLGISYYITTVVLLIYVTLAIHRDNPMKLTQYNV